MMNCVGLLIATYLISIGLPRTCLQSRNLQPGTLIDDHEPLVIADD